MVKPTAKGSWVGNGFYIAAAMQMATDCGVELSHWTHDIGATVKPVAVGNVIEAYATLLVKGRAWDELCSIMFYLAHHDSGGLSRVVAGRASGGVSGQNPPPGRSRLWRRGRGCRRCRLWGRCHLWWCGRGCSCGGHRDFVGGQHLAADFPDGTYRRHGSWGCGFVRPECPGRGEGGWPYPEKTHVMGSFASCEKDPEAWRRWVCWHCDLRPLHFVAAGVGP